MQAMLHVPGRAIVKYNESVRWAHLMGAVFVSADMVLVGVDLVD